jgi:hypothetical protein
MMMFNIALVLLMASVPMNVKHEMMPLSYKIQ